MAARPTTGRAAQRDRRHTVHRVRLRARPLVRVERIRGDEHCHVCVGVLPLGLPRVRCACGLTYHRSCAGQVEGCPVCGASLPYPSHLPKVVSEPSSPPQVRSAPLGRADAFLLLEDRFLLGETSGDAYAAQRGRLELADDSALFCGACGGEVTGGQPCECGTTALRRLCPECHQVLEEGRAFCGRCGLVLSPGFQASLFRCPDCGRVVTVEELECVCGAAFIDADGPLCPHCSQRLALGARRCPSCGRSTTEEIYECPRCGRRVEPDALTCTCGAVFVGRIDRIECPECGAAVDDRDRFCHACGVRFSLRPQDRP